MRQYLVRFCAVFLMAGTAQARLGETAQQAAMQYGSPIKTVGTPVDNFIGLYETNGFRILINFRMDKSYLEKFVKRDPLNPQIPGLISAAERDTLLKEDCTGCTWTSSVSKGATASGEIVETTTYDRSDGSVRAKYDTHSKCLIISTMDAWKVYESRKKQTNP